MKCRKVIEETWEILRLLGIDEQRLRLKWISASEGAAFAEEIEDFVGLLKTLGPNPLTTGEAPSENLHQAMSR